MTSRLVRPILPLLAVALAGCESAPNEPNVLGVENAAVVDGVVVPESVYRMYVFAKTSKNADELPADQQDALLQDLIGYQLMANAAAKEGLTTEARFAAELHLLRLERTALEQAKRHVAANPPTETALKALYDENLTALTEKDYKLRQIVMPSRDEALLLVAGIIDAKGFIAESDKRATDTISGDLGWQPPEAIAGPVLTLINTMAVGAYTTEPIRTSNGYVLLLLEDTRLQEPPTMDEVRSQLVAVAETNILRTYLDSLKEGATVEVVE